MSKEGDVKRLWFLRDLERDFRAVIDRRPEFADVSELDRRNAAYSAASAAAGECRKP